MSLPNRSTNTSSSRITIVGGGIAGLTAAIACAEGGANVSLLEAHSAVGGRARSCDGRYKANFGPHVLYKDGLFWRDNNSGLHGNGRRDSARHGAMLSEPDLLRQFIFRRASIVGARQVSFSVGEKA